MASVNRCTSNCAEREAVEGGACFLELPIASRECICVGGIAGSVHSASAKQTFLLGDPTSDAGTAQRVLFLRVNPPSGGGTHHIDSSCVCGGALNKIQFNGGRSRM